jgi:hypothetical protein
MKSIKKQYSNRIEYRNEQGDLHREDGPAIEYSDGYKEWFLNDNIYSEDDWKQKVTELKRILDL